MSKMRMPEMSVVRFNESDVIVASGSPMDKYVALRGWNDTTAKNGEVYYVEGSTETLIYNHSQSGSNTNRMNEYFGNGDTAYTFYVGNTPWSFSTMINSDTNGAATGNTDMTGTYEWYGGSIFKKQ